MAARPLSRSLSAEAVIERVFVSSRNAPIVALRRRLAYQNSQKI
jgi:hypothetical protein